VIYERFSEWYIRNYKRLMIIPALVLLTASLFMFITYRTTGRVFEKDLDLSGGTVATLYVPDMSPVQKAVFEAEDMVVREIRAVGSTQLVAIMVEAGPEIPETHMVELINSTFPGYEYDLRHVGPSMGASFMQSATKAVIFSFLLMGLILALIFRKPIVALTVILSGFLNVFEAATAMVLLGIKLSPHTIGALLMLMGWSVDSEVLFDSKLLREAGGGDPKKKAINAMKTAMTMSAAIFASLLALYFVSTARMVKEIALVLLLGAFFDIINTWFQSLSMVLWYVERQEKKQGGEAS